MSTEVWCTPHHPFKSSLTGAGAAALAALYTKETKKQWTQPLGFIHTLFEVGMDVLRRSASLDDKSAIIAAIKATTLNTIVGPIRWAKGPVPNVSKTPLVGGQWGRGKDVRFDVTIVSNRAAPSIPTAGTLRYRELERHHPGLHRRVIFFTGDALNPDTMAFLTKSGAPSLTKPSLPELRKLILQVLHALDD